MKKWLLIWCAMLAHHHLFADIHLRGILTLSGQPMFALSEDDSPAQWKRMGESFLGFELVRYNSASESLTLRNGDESKTIQLPASAVRDSAQTNLERLLKEAQGLADEGDDRVAQTLRRYRMMETLYVKGLERLTSKPMTRDEAELAKAFLAKRDGEVKEHIRSLEAEVSTARAKTK